MGEKMLHWLVASTGTLVLVLGFQNCGSLGRVELVERDFPPVDGAAGQAGAGMLKSISGAWSKGCEGEKDFTQSEVSFGPKGKATFEIKVGAGNCHPLVATHVEFEYQVGEPMALDSGETAFRLKARNVESGNITPLESAVAENFNVQQYCGVANWKVGEPRRVKFENCRDRQGNSLLDPFSKRNILYLSEDGLQMGSSQWRGQDGYPEVLELAVYRKAVFK